METNKNSGSKSITESAEEIKNHAEKIKENMDRLNKAADRAKSLVNSKAMNWFTSFKI